MAGLGFLDAIERGARDRVRAAMTIMNYDRGNLILSQHDEMDDVYFVLTGRARATIYSHEGKMVTYRDIGAGEVFGELAAIDSKPRSASVAALESLTIGRLTGPEFRALLEAEPALMWATMRYLTGQVRRMTERIFEYSTFAVKQRLVAELVRLARALATGGNTALLSPAPTHFELAATISTHREAVSRAMSELSKAGLIRKAPDGLHFLDIQGLEAAAEIES